MRRLRLVKTGADVLPLHPARDADGLLSDLLDAVVTCGTSPAGDTVLVLADPGPWIALMPDWVIHHGPPAPHLNPRSPA